MISRHQRAAHREREAVDISSPEGSTHTEREREREREVVDIPSPEGSTHTDRRLISRPRAQHTQKETERQLISRHQSAAHRDS